MENRRCWIEVSESACIHNINAMRKYLPDSTSMLAIVKANCYGHDASILPKVMEENGIHDFGVACVDEAVVLRDSGIRGSILVLEYIDRADWQRAVDYDCIMTVSSVEHAKDLDAWARENGILAAKGGDGYTRNVSHIKGTPDHKARLYVIKLPTGA